LVNAVDWSGVHLWWGDERFLKAGDKDRNETGARDALLDQLVKAQLLPEENIHPMPHRDKWRHDPVESAKMYAGELSQFATAGNDLPEFDVVMLGMGPDGHIASLFPEHGEELYSNGTTVAVLDSPKPPAERVSLTFRALNSANEVWLIVAGAEKAEKAAEALAGGLIDDVPAAGVHGKYRTLYLLDTAAADAP
jgi:6-phosphogluconolactonase